MQEVKLSVRSELDRILKDLQKLRDANGEVGDAFKDTSKAIDKAIQDNTTKTRKQLSDTANMGRRMADFIKDSFRNLFAVEAIKRGLDLQSQISKAVDETIRLNDTVMKLGRTYGMTGDQAARMVEKMSKKGLSAKAISDTMQGLRGTGVQGAGMIGEYSGAAGQLARISGNEESTGSISGLLARTLQAQGGNQNTPGAASALAESVYKATRTTGVASDQILQGMEQLFKTMPTEMRKSIGPDALAKMSSASALAGPGTTAAIEKALSMDKYQRAAFDATGFSKIFGKSGIDVNALKQFGKTAAKLGGGDLRAGVKFASGGGLGDQEAEGIVRLVEAADRIGDAQNEMSGIKQGLEDYEKATRTVGEAFKSVAARALGGTGIQGMFGSGQEYLKKRLNKYSESGIGSMGALGMGGLLAGGLLGAGGKGLGGILGLGGGVAKGLALQEGTGVTPVYVTNASEIGKDGLLDKLIGPGASVQAGGVLGKLGKVGAMAGTVGMGAGVGMLGYEAGNLVSEMMGGSLSEREDEYKKNNPSYGPEELSKPPVVAPGQNNFKIEIAVDSKVPNLQVTKKPVREMSN